MQKSKVAEQAVTLPWPGLSLFIKFLMVKYHLRRSHTALVTIAFVKFSATLFFTIIMAFPASAQLTGTKNIPGHYPTLEDAITDLNAQGVGAGGVIINLLEGNPQAAPAGGYIIGGVGSMVLTTASMTRPVILQGNGNVITAFFPQTSGLLNDALIKLIGADWVTINGFVLEEHPTNANTSATTNDMTEWGIALLYVAVTDGCQNITIQNNTIDLNRTYQNTFGIYANSTHNETDVTNSATAIVNGGNSRLKIYDNTVTDINIGIVVVGPTGAANHNDVLEIGGTDNENFITNYGRTGSISGYVNVSGSVNGIVIRNVKNYTISNNTISSSATGPTSGPMRGIYVHAFTNAPTGTITNTINNNIISVKSGVNNGTLQGIVVDNNTGNATTTLHIDGNDFNNSTHTSTTSGAITFISNGMAVLNSSISNNTFTNLSVNTTGPVTFISNNWSLPANGVKQVNSNRIVTGFARTVAGSPVTFIMDSGSDSPSGINTVHNNTFSNITVAGATTVQGIVNTNSGSPVKTVSNNEISNITGGTGSIVGLLIEGDGGAADIANNSISNLSGAGAITGISLGASGVGTTNVTQNQIHALTGTGGAAVIGISTGAPTATKKIFRNKIFNLQNSNASGAVYGVSVTSGLAVSIYNNLIGDLRLPIGNSLNSLIGINITSITLNSIVEVSYNTIYLNASSTGITFGSSGLYHTANGTETTATLNLRNNIIVNTSVPNGNGVTAAYRRSDATLNNYGASSNNNIFYAGSPVIGRAIFYDGINQDISLADYKARVSPRDANSFTENPPFLSTTGSSINFLHISTSSPTQIESGAVNITGITSDYDNIVRQGNAGYTGTGASPDIGADEGEFIPPQLTCNGAEGGTATGSVTFCGSGIPNITASGYSEGPGSSYQWQSSSDAAFGNTINIQGQTNPAALNTGTVSMTTYYRLKVTCPTGNSLDYSNTVEVAVNTLVVGNANDTGPGSLRAVINCASPGSHITFDPTFYGDTLVLTSGEIDINKNLYISGLGAANLAISGNNTSRVFHLMTGFQLKLTEVTLINGSSVTDGGAIFTEGSLILENVTLENNFENGIPKSLSILPPGSLQIFGHVNIND